MALTVSDVMELPSGQKMQLLAGAKGKDRQVVSVEIADYEFAPDVTFVPSAEFDLEKDMESDSFILTSFLFAKDDPGLILPAIQKLDAMGMAGLAFKQIIYENLPEDVLAYADKNDFPLFALSKDVWFENVIFDIMYAVQFDDKMYLSEEKISQMLSEHMSQSELEIILKGISLKIRPYVSVVFIPGDLTIESGTDAGRIQRSFFLHRELHDKGLMVRCWDGLFLIITSARKDFKSHDLIRREFFEVLGLAGNLPKAAAMPCYGMSDVHASQALNRAFREGWLCYLASKAENRIISHFGESGCYRVLLPAMERKEAPAFAQDILSAFENKADLRETVEGYVDAGGDIPLAAETMHCHHNTVRYRLSRIRELTGLEDATDGEFYLQMKMAVAIDRVKNIQAGRG